jgi:hypothetical protein
MPRSLPPGITGSRRLAEHYTPVHHGRLMATTLEIVMLGPGLTATGPPRGTAH